MKMGKRDGALQCCASPTPFFLCSGLKTKTIAWIAPHHILQNLHFGLQLVCLLTHYVQVPDASIVWHDAQGCLAGRGRNQMGWKANGVLRMVLRLEDHKPTALRPFRDFVVHNLAVHDLEHGSQGGKGNTKRGSPMDDWRLNFNSTSVPISDFPGPLGGC